MKKLLGIALVFVCILGGGINAFSADKKVSEVVSIPAVEMWEMSAEQGSDEASSENDMIVSRRYKDPRGNGYEGVVLYRTEVHSLSVIAKMWNVKRTSSGISYKESRIVLITDTGEWVVGKPGEAVSLKYVRDKKRNLKFIEISFDGREGKKLTIPVYPEAK